MTNPELWDKVRGADYDLICKVQAQIDKKEREVGLMMDSLSELELDYFQKYGEQAQIC